VTPARSDTPRSSRRAAVAIAREPTATPVRPPRREAAAAPTIFVLPAAPPDAPTSRRDTPPLSDAAVASRVSRPEASPVIHVTIDRIDVRAPDVAKPAAPSKPQRRQSAISLSDYLRNSSGSRA